MGDTSNSHTNYGLGGVVSGVAQIGSHLIGETIIDFLRRNFTRDGRLQHGDIYVDQSRILLQRHLSLMHRDDQNTIRKKYIDLMSLRNNLGSPQLWAANFILGTEYKRKCKKTYLIVEDASNRAVNDTLMAQMNEAIGDPQSPRNPFVNSRSATILSDVTIDDLDRVEVEAYQSDETGEAAVVLGLHKQDETMQHLVATFSPAILGVSTDRAETSSISTYTESVILGPPSTYEEER